MSNKTRKSISRTAALILGSVLFAMSLNMFLLPAEIVLGGMTGISTVINIFFGFPVGVMIIILNIPLVAANAVLFGKGFLGRTMVGIITTCAACDIITFFPVTETDPLMCSILGGAVMGAAMGIILSRGFSTGGTDLIAVLVRRKMRNISTGKIIMICDFLIIIGAAVITGNYGGLFYSAVCTWISGQVLDMVLSGSERAGQVFIISEKADELVSLIFKKLDRGVTVINATGGYTGEARRVIMCALPKRELYYLKELVSECDPRAFCIIASASEVRGRGFASSFTGEAVSTR